jgi:O-antigen biosynthesis protein
MALLKRILRALPWLVLSPLIVGLPPILLAISDLLWKIFGRRKPVPTSKPLHQSNVSVVIPNWNGRDLLERYLPSVITAVPPSEGHEILVVDNGSTDGSAEFVRAHFPEVTLLALPKNLGFGGGSNAGFRAAKNPIVVLLNSDMRVDPNFLAPLLESFRDPQVVAVSCQIFFSDPTKKREETGLTQGWWENGRLNVRHQDDGAVKRAYPCFYGGGGSCAFHRDRFLELGGFDELLAPFYLEDTDIGYLAWKRGWKVLYEPRSIVFHEHRGTIGKKFSPDYIQSIVKKNFLLFTWKNIHEWRRLAVHFTATFAECLLSILFGETPQRTNFNALARAFAQLPAAMRSRWHARSLSVINDTEAFRRPRGDYFRDRFLPVRRNADSEKPLRVLFVSPYPICPPIHGGAVFMYQTADELTRLCELHIVTLLDFVHEAQAHAELASRCASFEYLVRMKGSAADVTGLTPHAIDEYHNAELDWLIERQIYLNEIDVVQLEYLPMAQYAGDFHRIAKVLFEHDIYFQSIGRQLPGMRGAIRRWKARLEYLRAFRYEIATLPALDRVQVCSRENADFLASYLPEIKPKLDDDLRAGIDISRYHFEPRHREPLTILFLGSFRHTPNVEALNWLVLEVMPHIAAAEPGARLTVIGSDPPPRHSFPETSGQIELLGFVPDILEPLARHSVFVCPILSGSGIRVKLLEAYAAGIPVVSTRIGAEGLGDVDGEYCALADDPREFAEKVVHLLRDPERAAQMAERARAYLEREHDIRVKTRRLVERYRHVLNSKAP